MKPTSTDKTISLLFSGKHPQTKKYAGKHVLVIDNEIVELTGRKKDIEIMKQLKDKHGETPTIVTVPSRDEFYFF